MDRGELPLQCEPCSVEAYGIPALIKETLTHVQKEFKFKVESAKGLEHISEFGRKHRF